LYLDAARWGFDQLIAQKLLGHAFRFQIIGILASLRAVQHALDGHDRDLSRDHQRVISEWWNRTKDDSKIPDLQFIRQARNLILKKGAFEAYATVHEFPSGETTYDLGYWEGKNRHDLDAAIRSALKWCDGELTALEAQLPDVEPPKQ
jgi:hypothetical protein